MSSAPNMDAFISHMDRDDLAQAFQTAKLEHAYARALQKVERIYDEERQRALRVQLLLLEDDNDGLNQIIEQTEDEVSRLEGSNEDLRQHISEISEDLQQTQTDLKMQIRDNDRIKAEVNALNASNSDATRMLSEKLALARELTTLKPEVEHLRSQAATQQNFLAEKLGLQRELSTLQVELETEKRAVQRLKSHQKDTTAADAAVDGQMAEIKHKLAEAVRQMQKIEKENRAKAVEWANEKEVLEGKLDAFRNKLRTTKEQLKEAQDELEKAQAAKMAQSAELTKARLMGANPKKRNVARFDPDMTIGTPGHGRPAAKKQRTSVAVGDKSTFSMTPFLNKTLSILPESPSDEQPELAREVENILHDRNDEVSEEKSVETTIAAPSPKPVAKTLAVANKKASKPLAESKNTKVKAAPASSLFRIAEAAEDIENAATASMDKPATTEPTKKKQPVLPKRTNIFDDVDEAGTTSKSTSNFLAPTTTSLKGNTLGGNTSLFGATALGTKKISLASLSRKKGKEPKLLAEFSPLKKDRRAGSVVVA